MDIRACACIIFWINGRMGTVTEITWLFEILRIRPTTLHRFTHGNSCSRTFLHPKSRVVDLLATKFNFFIFLSPGVPVQ